MSKDQVTETENLEETSEEEIVNETEAPVEELDEAPAGVEDLGGDNPDTGIVGGDISGAGKVKKAPARKADKSGGESRPPALKEDKAKTKNGMVAQVYEMMKGLSKDELTEKFGLIKDVVELDLSKLEEQELEETKEMGGEGMSKDAKNKMMGHSSKPLTSEDIEIDVKDDVAAIAEGEELSEEFKQKTAVIFEAAVKAKVIDEVNSRISQIEEEYLKEVDEANKEFQSEMVEKVDDYLKYVVQEWLEDNKIAVEKGIRSELVEDFMIGLKNLFKEHYIDIPEEKVDIVDDLFEKVDQLEEKLNEEIESGIQLKKEIEHLSKESALNDVCENLADTQKEKISDLAENVEYDTDEQYKAKLEMLKESYFPAKEVVNTEDDETYDTSVTPEELNEEIEEVQTKARDAAMSSYIEFMGRANKDK